MDDGRYYCSLDGSGYRLDRKDRPELSRGSVDFVATHEYCQRPPQRLIYIFVVDVSPFAVSTGAAAASLSAVRSAIVSLASRFPPTATTATASTFSSSSSTSTKRSGGGNGKERSEDGSGGGGGDGGASVGIVTFDSRVHFYTVKGE